MIISIKFKIKVWFEQQYLSDLEKIKDYIFLISWSLLMLKIYFALIKDSLMHVFKHGKFYNLFIKKHKQIYHNEKIYFIFLQSNLFCYAVSMKICCDGLGGQDIHDVRRG